MVYDITSRESFAKAQYWVSELQKNASADIGEARQILSLLSLQHVQPSCTHFDGYEDTSQAKHFPQKTISHAAPCSIWSAL